MSIFSWAPTLAAFPPPNLTCEKLGPFRNFHIRTHSPQPGDPSRPEEGSLWERRANRDCSALRGGHLLDVRGSPLSHAQRLLSRSQYPPNKKEGADARPFAPRPSWANVPMVMPTMPHQDIHLTTKPTGKFKPDSSAPCCLPRGLFQGFHPAFAEGGEEETWRHR